MATSPHITVSQLSCIRQQQRLFTDLSFTLRAGEALFIEGPNGSGKSSLLRLLASISTPASGDVSWCEQSIYQPHPDFLDALHYVGHANGIKLGLTVLENIALMERLGTTSPVRPEEHAQRASRRAARAPQDEREILSLLQLDKHQHTLAHHLSAGQRRRLALARLFLYPKPLWLLDEPFTALDVATQAILIKEIETHLAQGGIVIASSHHPIVIATPAKTLRLPLC